MICLYDITLQLYKLCHQNMQCVFYLMTWEVSSWQKPRDLRLVICEVSGDHWKAYVHTYINGIFNRIWPATTAMDRSHYSARQVGTSREFEQWWFKLNGGWIHLEIGRIAVQNLCWGWWMGQKHMIIYCTDIGFVQPQCPRSINKRNPTITKSCSTAIIATLAIWMC